MPRPILTSNEVCETFIVSDQELRTYEKQTLLAPITDGNRRLYCEAQLARLRVILRAKELGFSVENTYALIAALLNPTPDTNQISNTVAIANKQLTELESVQALLADTLQKLRKEITVQSQFMTQRPDPMPVVSY